MNTAVLVVDTQVGVMAKAIRRSEVLETIRQLVDRAREEKVPVIWVQHVSDEMPPGSDAWKIVPELMPLKNELIIQKSHGDSFEGTDLLTILQELQLGRLVVTGAQTEACIRSTIHGAFTRGYDTVLVSDAHTTEDLTEYGLPAPEALVKFTNIYWSFQTAPGKTASVEKSADVQLKRP
jgi:nicotinamidase-related amidase